MNVRLLTGVPEIVSGDDLPTRLARLAAADGMTPGDVLVVAHKIVSKAEGQLVRLADVEPGQRARELGERANKDPALCELILSESRAIIRQRNAVVIAETHHGFICANAGIDSSNVAAGTVLLLPRDPDRSARHIQAKLAAAVGGRAGVVITDTHGRAWRRGLINLAIGVAGFAPVVDYRGGRDREGNLLVATDQGLADELAAAAGALMGKAAGTPAAIVSGVETIPSPGGVADLLRDPELDLFR